MIRIFDKQDLRNISDVLSEIITHSKITEYLRDCNISESEGSNKSDRIYYALKERQDKDGCGNNVAAFILRIISPKRYNSELEFENDRLRIPGEARSPFPVISVHSVDGLMARS